MAFTLTGGGDHEGADWTPADASTIAGVHYNIGTFLVTNGWTVNIDTGTELEVYATTITVAGTINGNEKGSQGTSGGGAGSGGGEQGTYSNGYRGGGGAGYGGAGGDGGLSGADAPAASGGSVYDTASDAFISMGSAGGGGGTASDRGGHGGGSVALYGVTVSVTGTMNNAGGDGQTGGGQGSGGGGSGGGILLVGDTVVATGTFNYGGGDTPGAGVAGEGGSGGGGRRIFLYYTSLNTSGITEDASAGTPASDGQTGDAGVGASAKISQCTSAIAQGQTFTIGSDSASMIDKITLWVTAVNTGGDFILKVWDSTSKSTEYGTKTVTVSGTGATDFTFADWIRVPDGESTYYAELTTAGAGNIELGVYGISALAGGDFYRNVKVVSYFDLYHVVYSIDHVKDAVVYNIADTTVKSSVTNLMLIGAVHRINADNTGTIQYTDDFITDKYLGDYTAISGVTHDAGNDELDIADTGYISYTIDTKYIITGVPTLTAAIDITAGTPTIQISSNGSTWYDIDTVVVDDVSTEYDLDDSTNLSLKGLTTFYLRFYCAGAGTNTCSIKTFTLDVDIVTVDVPNPVINTGAENTFTCDQDSDSGIDCEIELIYRDRKWT